MCGVVGYIGEREALPIIINGLAKLEYRGYDSAGIAVIKNGQTHLKKAAGRLANLEQYLSEAEAGATIGIGHTRWATHGRPSDHNSHPHTDCTGRFVVVHNGIVENYLPLKEELLAAGHTFKSETDTEVIPHLIESLYNGDIVETVRAVVGRLRGAYSLAVLCQDEPDKIVAVRLTSPLVIGLGDGENFLASDIPAILEHTRRALILEDSEMAIITKTGVNLQKIDGTPVQRDVLHVDWDPGQAEKGGYPHFLIKEIHEQPRVIRDTLTGRIDVATGRVQFPELGLTAEQLAGIKKVAIVACGTSSNAGLVGKHLIEKLARLPVEWDIASEYRYRDPMVDEGTLLVAISQSGETVDTLAALREAKSKGAKVIGIANVVGSSITREADWNLYTWAGPEISVASTKAYTTQVTVLSLLALYLAQARGTITEAESKEMAQALFELSGNAQRVLEQEKAIATAAQYVAKHDDCFFIGRQMDYAVTLEGQLKLKEISYIHAEGYAAGELKHGTLALITDGIPVVALNTQPHVLEKTISNIQEVRARDAWVLGIALEGDTETGKHCDVLFTVPQTHPLLTPILSVLPLQLLSYYAATARGCDVDKPRNLAKSVTVE